MFLCTALYCYCYAVLFCEVSLCWMSWRLLWEEYSFLWCQNSQQDLERKRFRHNNTFKILFHEKNSNIKANWAYPSAKMVMNTIEQIIRNKQKFYIFLTYSWWGYFLKTTTIFIHFTWNKLNKIHCMLHCTKRRRNKAFVKNWCFILFSKLFNN